MRRKLLAVLLFLFVLTLTACVTTEDVNKPQFEGLNNITYTIGDPKPDYLDGVNAFDVEDGDLTENIFIDDSKVDYQTAGSYEITYAVIDSEGHLTKLSVTVTVIERIDETQPQLFGINNITITVGDPIPNYLLNITATDNIDGDLTSQVTYDDSLVLYEVPGTYLVTYTVSDEAGNTKEETMVVTILEASLNASYDIYYLNDFHGAILEDSDSYGFAKIANVIMTKKEASPQSTIFIAGGDMLQGSLLSNYYQGASVIDMLNLMELDAFVLGNHEFDWGLDVVLDYFNPQSDAPVHANFPLLAANLIEKSTGERPDFVDPYTIIEKQGYKIGVIGTIGYGLESSIAASRVADYEFLEPVEFVELYATYLRTIEDVDIVIAVNHDDSDYYNQSVASLTGDARVDAIYNGHSHQKYVESYQRDGMNTYIMQSGANGSALGYANLVITDGVLTNYTARNLSTSTESLLYSKQNDMETLINDYLANVADLISTNIITSGEYLSQVALTNYMAKIMRVKTDSDIAFHNTGGTRTAVSSGQNMTVALAYEIFPFDNVVKTTELLGSTVKYLMGRYGYDTEIASFDDDTYYKVATNDYIYDGNPNTFNAGLHPENTYLLLRDLFIGVLEDLRDSGYDTFYLNLDIPEPLSIDTYIILMAKESTSFHDIILA